MNRHFFTAVFALGALAVAWVGAGFMGSNPLALTMTLIIGAVYVFGALELHRFRQASTALATALAAIPEHLTQLADWLPSVPSSLQNAVRLRIEGERVGLPGPALTPYLVGLLVMLGMLGTFLGMVVTLNGAVFALEGTSDLQSIRSAFSAPIKGLGLAFGTSVAGVASSAMLGLMSALSRHERTLTAQWLDSRIATALRAFSLTHQRQESFKALQLQSQVMPGLVDKLQTMMSQMERMSLQLNERLLSNQEHFHRDVKAVYTDLAGSVDQSLRDALTQSAQMAGASIKPVVESAMTGIAQESKLMHERMIGTTQTQLDGLSARFGASASAVADTWTAALANHEQSSASLVTGVGRSLESFNNSFEQRSAALLLAVNAAYATLQAEQASNDQQRLAAWTGSLEASTSTTLTDIARLMRCSEESMRSRVVSEADWTRQHGEHMDQLTRLLREELGALRDAEALRGNAAVDRLGELQTALTRHLTTLGTALEDPISRLIQTASDAPRAAAEVIGQMRQELSNSVARDNDLLEERSRIMETLSTLLNAINHASLEQRAVIDTLVASSTLVLQHAGSEFSDKADVETAKLADIAANVTSSAVDVSSLSESFGFAVRSFTDANEKLIVNLQRIEGAMDKSMARSDDQLAYYVAQAREIIDLSTLSQKEIIDALRQIPGPQAVLAEEAA